MLISLEQAYHTLADPPDLMQLSPCFQGTGQNGRPRIQFDPQFLSFAVQVQGVTQIARVFGCSPRTVRRRILEAGIFPPGQAPFVEVMQPNGTRSRSRQGIVEHTRLSDISDADLDCQVTDIIRSFPKFGRRMVDGALQARGIQVSRARIVASLRRIKGSVPSFNRRQIERRSYQVCGVNSVWHHDGHHCTSQ